MVLDNLAGRHRVTTGRQVPFCLFTDPELARVGLTEREAKERGVEYRLAKIPMAHVLRTHTLSETRGFMKALIEKDGDRILGFTAFGVEAGEVMVAVQVAMAAGLPYTVLRDLIVARPDHRRGDRRPVLRRSPAGSELPVPLSLWPSGSVEHAPRRSLLLVGARGRSGHYRVRPAPTQNLRGPTGPTR